MVGEGSRVVERVDVAIVGAGAAGLAAARDLHEAGLRLAVLEARERLGGRVLTRRAPGVPLPIELGAEFLHAGPEETLAILSAAGDVALDGRGEHRQARGGRITLHRFEAHVEAVMRRIPRRGADRPLAEFLARKPGGRARAEARRVTAQFVQGFHSADLDVIGTRPLAPEPGDSPADTAVRVARARGGMDGVIRMLARGLGGRIRLRSTVTRIAWDRRGAEVNYIRGSRERRLRARAVLVTVPIGVLAAPAGARGAIAFEPEPPALGAAIAGIAMGSVVKLVFAFHELPWQDHASLGNTDAEDVAFLHTPGEFNVWWRAHPARWPLVTAWSGGPPAAALSRLPRERRVRVALGELAAALGRTERSVRARVKHVWTHDWVNDPWTRGSYTYLRVNGEGAGRRLARPVRGTLFFAGEATEEDQAGTVEGAIVSGRRAAKQVRRALE